MTQITLWLLPLLLGSAFGIYSSIKVGIRWSWGVLIQHALVMLIAILGLTTLSKWDWICAYLGWGLLLSFTVITRMLLMKMTQSLGLLRCQQAISTARLMRFIMWGPPGKFWLDLAYMIDFYLKSDIKSANEIYTRWQEFKLPKNIAESLSAYAMLGLLVMRDWEATIAKYVEAKARYENDLKSKKKDLRFPSQVAIPAIRAYNETGRYKESAQALLLADLPSSSYGRDSLETIFLSHFALLGSLEDLDEVLKSMKGNKSALPKHAQLYWQARCYSARHEYEEAVRLFSESLKITPEKDSAWRERTQVLLQHNQEILRSANIPALEPETIKDRADAARSARAVMDQCLAISEILNSRKAPIAVRVLTGVISICFICMFSPLLLGDKSYLSISKFFYDYCILDSQSVMNGQWWRLLSYQFMHGGASHLFMNLFGLVWFGRYVENLFGSKNLLIIFFASGVLSGLAQVIMDPEGRAVGASGAIMGIFGAGLAATIRLKNVLPKSVRKHELSWMIALAVTQLIFDQVVNFLFPANGSQQNAVRIAAAAHFGGMISGFAIGWILPLRKMGRSEINDVK